MRVLDEGVWRGFFFSLVGFFVDPDVRNALVAESGFRVDCSDSQLKT